MPITIKELIVVLALASVVFRLAQPIALRFCDERDYSRRRNLWFLLTVTAFLSPSFWLFMLVAAPLLVWAGRKDKNPVALYLLMLHVVPAVHVTIPFPGINSLFALDNYRLLSFCILIPTAWRLRKSKDTARLRGITLMDVLLLAYGALQVLLFVPPDLPNHIILRDSFTNDLRSSFLFLIDFYILYYTVSRSCSNRQSIMDAQAAFCLSCAVMAALAVFETLRHWQLYADVALRWAPNINAGYYYLSRGDMLRAQASSGNTLALGYLLAIACGFWHYLKSHIGSTLRRFGVMLLLWAGLLATYSRGPLMGLVVIYVVIVAVGPRTLPRFVKGGIAAMLLVMFVSQTPLGARIVQMLPFVKGSVDEQANSSITYRQHLVERSWELIKKHPFFGDQFALQKLEDMRQGEGIIDLVNTYVEVTLFYGFIGLATFIGLMLFAVYGVYRVAKRMVRVDYDLALMGFALLGCIMGTLFMLATCSFILGYQKLFYVIAGFAAAYVHFGRLPEPDRRAYSFTRSPELR